MALVEDKRTGGFAFTWSIHNFSHSVHKMILHSPKFVAKLIGDEKWSLMLFLRPYSAAGFISFYVMREEEGNTAATFSCVLSIRVSNGLFKNIEEYTFDDTSSSYHGHEQFLSLSDLKEPGAYLDNDTLTLRCRMWKDDADLLASLMYYAHTKIKVTRIDYVWTLDDCVVSDNENNFNHTAVIQSISTDIPCFKIQLVNAETDDIINFSIEQASKETYRLFFTCVIHLLDAEGRVAHSVRGEHLFENSSGGNIWTLPFLSKRELLSKEKVYLPKGKLSLLCEFSASSGDENSEVERLEYGMFHKLVLDLPADPWKENMRRFYNEGKFSDFTVRTPGTQFPVHKAILGAQSEVFSAMFDSDMKENRTGVVEIEDLEDDTVSKMLQFIYTDTLDDIDCSMACKLYCAAGKYRITSLQKKCSNFLINGLDTSNACDVLSLADTYHDQQLKLVARDFVISNAHEIMNTEEWKKLMEAKAHLSSETMHLMICKNFLGNPKP